MQKEFYTRLIQYIITIITPTLRAQMLSTEQCAAVILNRNDVHCARVLLLLDIIVSHTHRSDSQR